MHTSHNHTHLTPSSHTHPTPITSHSPPHCHLLTHHPVTITHTAFPLLQFIFHPQRSSHHILWYDIILWHHVSITHPDLSRLCRQCPLWPWQHGGECGAGGEAGASDVHLCQLSLFLPAVWLPTPALYWTGILHSRCFLVISGTVLCHVLLCMKALNFNRFNECCRMVQVSCPYIPHSCLNSVSTQHGRGTCIYIL